MDDYSFIKAITLLVSCSLSVISTGLFLIFYVKYGEFKNNFASQLILILALCDLLCWGQCLVTSIYILAKNTVAYEFNESLCVYLAYIVNFSSLSVLITVFLISFSIYLSTVRNIVITRYQLLLWFIAAFFVLIMSFLPFLVDEYGPVDGVLCWVTGKNMKFFSYYILILLIFIVDYYCIIKTLFVIRRLPLQAKVKMKLRRHLILFPLIFIFSFSAGLINSIITVINPEIDIFWLEVLDYVLEPTDGILNPIAYMLINEKMAKGIKEFFFGKKKKNINNEESMISDSDMSQRKSSGVVSTN